MCVYIYICMSTTNAVSVVFFPLLGFYGSFFFRLVPDEVGLKRIHNRLHFISLSLSLFLLLHFGLLCFMSWLFALSFRPAGSVPVDAARRAARQGQLSFFFFFFFFLFFSVFFLFVLILRCFLCS